MELTIIWRLPAVDPSLVDYSRSLTAWFHRPPPRGLLLPRPTFSSGTIFSGTISRDVARALIRVVAWCSGIDSTGQVVIDSPRLLRIGNVIPSFLQLPPSPRHRRHGHVRLVNNVWSLLAWARNPEFWSPQSRNLEFLSPKSRNLEYWSLKSKISKSRFLKSKVSKFRDLKSVISKSSLEVRSLTWSPKSRSLESWSPRSRSPDSRVSKFLVVMSRISEIYRRQWGITDFCRFQRLGLLQISIETDFWSCQS